LLITRTPLRISIGGGGTDLPSYYERDGGFVISAAIDRYVYIALNRTFTDDYFLKYSAIERVSTVDEINHPIIREALRRHDIGPAVELVSVADVPSGTGLGSSGSFTVGLLRALHAFERTPVGMEAIAEEAFDLEANILGQPGGKQDQYIAAYGGLTAFTFGTDGSVGVAPLAVSDETMFDLETHLLLFFTGYSRSSAAMLGDQTQRTQQADADMIESLDRTKALGFEIQSVLEAGDTMAFAKLMHEHWVAKRRRTDGMSNTNIDQWYEIARNNGAIGGKLVGAGAGGFLMVYAEDPARVRRAMTEAGLTEMRTRFDLDGSVVMSRD
jgi:D-glycero-alpha-D-manno-heptose-7-phosphate kinase